MWPNVGGDLEQLFERCWRRRPSAINWTIACCEQSVDRHGCVAEWCWVDLDNRDADFEWEFIVGNAGKCLSARVRVCGRSRAEQIPLTMVSRDRKQRDSIEMLVEKRPMDHPREES
ncbi:hypothetical protein C464_01651 [Halorubrum coriense DSM 10284]|uniref:Uncharacterized protein n=1 Tax=Halorubrum coriense DSM 10284 TaxID=1227466 RepID=M0ESK7_9EURY|nr:hypothetical protein C464_01651 [Halorubrum coriense DSM 10284]